MEGVRHAVVSSVSDKRFDLLCIKIGTSSWSNDKGQSVGKGWGYWWGMKIEGLGKIECTNVIAVGNGRVVMNLGSR
jgi:hypothetical protein